MSKVAKRKKNAEKTRETSSIAPIGPVATEPPKPWTFLTNHTHVLALLYAQPDIVLREVASRVGITERAVQRIVQDLEEDGFIKRERVGRRNRYEIIQDLHLRHPIEEHRTIGELLDLIKS